MRGQAGGVVTGALAVVPRPGRPIDEITESVRTHIERGREGLLTTVDAYFAIGRDLLEARTLLPADRDYGAWVKDNFNRSTRWAWNLTAAARDEDAVRGAVGSQLLTGESLNFEKALNAVRKEKLEAKYGYVPGDRPEVNPWKKARLDIRKQLKACPPLASIPESELASHARLVSDVRKWLRKHEQPNGRATT